MKKIYIISMLIGLITLACSKYYYIFPEELQDKKLYLLSIEDKSIPHNSKAYIILKEGYFKAFSGCNDFNGTFEIDTERVTFKVEDIDTNVCPYLAIQHSFLEHLVYTSSIVVKNRKVYFKNKEKILLIFKKQVLD